MIIAVLDDDPIWVEKVAVAAEKYMNSYYDVHDMFSIEKYTRPEAMLEKIKDDEYFDIFLLDVKMGENNGLQMLEDIQRQYINPVCIFITDYYEYAPEGYKYNAFRYILKSQLDEKLPEALASAIQKRNEQKAQDESGFMVIEIHQNMVKLFYKEILYIKKDGKNLCIQCRKQNYIFRADLKNIWKKLNHMQFAYSDRGWIVNLRYVHETQKDMIILDNNEKVPMSRGKSAEFKAALRRYLQDYA